MDEAKMEEFRQTILDMGKSKVNLATNQGGELSANQQFIKECGEAWIHLAEKINLGNAASIDRSFIISLESATQKAIVDLEQRIMAIEDRLNTLS